MATSGSIGFIVKEVPDAFRERSRIRKWLHRVAQDHGTRIDAINLVLMTDEGLLYYNQTFLGHNDYTDVITFPVESNNGVAGDILMSYERIKENATTFQITAAQELRRVMVHGLLHLLGHSDKSKAQRESMHALEEKYMARFPRS